MGGSGMEGGIGDGSGGSNASGLLWVAVLEAEDGAMLRRFMSKGGGRGPGLYEFRRVGSDWPGCWPLDLRRLVGGVETVREAMLGLPA